MRKVFSSNVTSQTMLVRDALQRHGLEVTVQNASESLSPVPGFSPPAEIWAMRDGDYEYAQRIIKEALAVMAHQADLPEWMCGRCHEANPPSFEVCWNCGADRGKGGDHG